MDNAGITDGPGVEVPPGDMVKEIKRRVFYQENFTAGDSRLADALAGCEENGWDALPLAAKQLTRLFRELWSTERAAENWRRKNPLFPLISIIRIFTGITYSNTFRKSSMKS